MDILGSVHVGYPIHIHAFWMYDTMMPARMLILLLGSASTVLQQPFRFRSCLEPGTSFKATIQVGLAFILSFMFCGGVLPTWPSSCLVLSNDECPSCMNICLLELPLVEFHPTITL